MLNKQGVSTQAEVLCARWEEIEAAFACEELDTLDRLWHSVAEGYWIAAKDGTSISLAMWS